MSLKNPTTPGLLIDGQWSKAWSHSCRDTMWSSHGSKCWGHGFIYNMYSCMYWICIQKPVKPTGNLTQLYKKPLRMPGIYQVELRPTWGRSPKFQAWQHGTYGFGDLWFGALFWTRLVSFGSETVHFLLGLFILSHSQMTHGVRTINQIWSFTPKTWLFLKKEL